MADNRLPPTSTSKDARCKDGRKPKRSNPLAFVKQALFRNASKRGGPVPTATPASIAAKGAIGTSKPIPSKAPQPLPLQHAGSTLAPSVATESSAESRKSSQTQLEYSQTDDTLSDIEDSGGDRSRALERYRKAVESLKAILESQSRLWPGFELLRMSELGSSQEDESVKDAIDRVLLCRAIHANNSNSLTDKLASTCRKVFIALCPLTKHVLIIGRDSQAVDALQMILMERFL